MAAAAVFLSLLSVPRRPVVFSRSDSGVERERCVNTWLDLLLVESAS